MEKLTIESLDNVRSSEIRGNMEIGFRVFGGVGSLTWRSSGFGT
jgi:hypothetical protein